jgi:hypothetical protein
MCHFELVSRKNGLQGTWAKMRQNLRWIPSRTEYIATWICRT